MRGTCIEVTSLADRVEVLIHCHSVSIVVDLDTSARSPIPDSLNTRSEMVVNPDVEMFVAIYPLIDLMISLNAGSL